VPSKEFSIRGVIPNLITPFTPDGNIAWDAVRREAAYLDGSGVDGISIGAFMSQTAGLTPEELFRLCEMVRKLARKPLLCTILPDSEPEAILLLEAVTNAGADAVLVAQPHYLFQPDTSSLMSMFERLQARTRVPILLANLLGSALVGLPAMRRLIDGGFIDGILQGGGNGHLMVDLLRLRPRVPVFSGLEDLHYVGLLLGAEGLISDLAALFPAESAGLYRDFLGGNHEKARTTHERLLRLWRVMDHSVEQLARLRFALSLQGRDAGAARSPFTELSAEAARHVTETLEREGVSRQMRRQ